MREWVNLANIITSANLAAGFLAVLMVSDGQLVAAGALVALAAGLDAIDGVVARRSHCAGHFGCNLDSLADVVSFGVVPAMLLHAGPLAGLPVVGGTVCLAFVLAGAWRLARFPLVADSPHWVGLPIPAGGLIATAAATLMLPPVPVLALTLTVALLMISSLPFPTLRVLAELAPHPRRAVRRSSRGVVRGPAPAQAVSPSRRRRFQTGVQAARSKAAGRPPRASPTRESDGRRPIT